MQFTPIVGPIRVGLLPTNEAAYLLAAVSKPSAPGNAGLLTPAYVAHSTFLSPAERSFFGVLVKATENEYRIFAKVRLADLIKPENTPNRKQWQTAFNRTSAKHVDFVICRWADLSVAAVVELDDSTHARSDRKERDIFIDSALTSARIPILHVRASQSYSPQQLKMAVQNVIDQKTAASNPIE